MFCYLEEAASILVIQVNIDHLQQHLNLIVAHLVVAVSVSPTHISMNPGDTVKEALVSHMVYFNMRFQWLPLTVLTL